MIEATAQDKQQARSDLPSLWWALLFAFCVSFLAEAILHPKLAADSYLTATGRVAISFLLAFTIQRFACVSLPAYRPQRKDLFTLLALTLGAIATIFVCRLLAVSVASHLTSSQHLGRVGPESFYFGIPFAAGAMLLQAVLGTQYALVYAISSSVLLSLYFPAEMFLVPYALVTSMVACLSFVKFRTRSAYIKAGLNVSFVAFPCAIASVLMEPTLSAIDVTIRLSSALAGGILCSFITAGVIPVLEHLGGYVTDIRLLEMATLDHPLLKELSIQAPGTWNHSMVMGMMVEAAADAIGANPVLARVGAYFHDIGKMKKPLYFAENQEGGDNRHDRLSPSMSALIIRAHVKDGIEMAQQHGLPESLVAMIPQHHGTALIEYFYDKACREAGEKEQTEAGLTVDENLYRYPGPKPQTREAGILMLADGIEAAARTLSEPSSDRIQGLVQKLMNKIFSGGQLSECDLTLQDLHQIAKCFTRVLTAIYHQRIAYAEPAEKVNDRERERPREYERELAAAPQEAGPNSEPQEVPKEKAPENLKRLGM